MAANRTLLVALAIGWVAALAGLVWMMTAAGARFHHVPFFLIDMNILLKACALLSVASAVIGIVSVLVGARPRLWIGVGGAAGWGVLGGLYGAAGARSMLINMNPPIPFSIYASNYAEAFLVLLIGLTGAMLCLGLFAARSPGVPAEASGLPAVARPRPRG